MIVQEIHLGNYGWSATIYYAEAKCLCEEVLAELREIGAEEGDLADIGGLLQRCDRNTGFTYSTPRGKSVVYIAPTDDASQFMDTYDHEKGHLAKHIALYRNINPWGEEYEYLAGEIGRQTFPAAKRFLCDGCRKKHSSEVRPHS